jgi:hypothetical protein
MLRLARLTVLLALTHVACLGSLVAPVVGVPMLMSLCSAAVL